VGGAVAVERTVNGKGDNGPAAGGTGHAAGTDGAARSARGEPASGAAAIGAADNVAKIGGAGSSGAADRVAGRERDGSLTALEEKKQSDGINGFEPIQGESNGERAREFAAGRGEGHHNGLNKPHRGVEKHAATDGSNGNAYGRSKPDKVKQGPQRPDNEKQGPQRPDNAGPDKNHAQPAPKPEHPLTPNFLPDLTPPPGQTKDPKPPKEDRPPKENGQPSAESVLAP
jgi:hypothetical protein